MNMMCVSSEALQEKYKCKIQWTQKQVIDVYACVLHVKWWQEFISILSEKDFVID